MMAIIKTMEEVIKLKGEVERELAETLNEFQMASGCQIESLEMLMTSKMGSRVSEIYDVQIKAHLPRIK